MKLYLISQTENTGYDTYDSAVVAAENEENAKRISPGKFYTWSNEQEGWIFNYIDGRKEKDNDSTWANDLEAIKVEFIGIAKDGTKSGVVCASFNAG